ncbi:hypothetical protein VA7868_04489 [Vibrio aerogenes CECT 7868]|uniref:Uncharacterized protein n=1 Tax=Vibrio aerogenes CECT 7868 TaxID=1216006 RepID=A0A1M6ENL9_9VIBR|nr:hypothetical protein [Vibrio aerogenes]SHI87054.1 hypothetical protein VA7868_04489 [Vibrio aerogenes CECT 7868]
MNSLKDTDFKVLARKQKSVQIKMRLLALAHFQEGHTPELKSLSSLKSAALERVYLSSPFLLEAIFYSGKAANLDNSNLYLTFANAVRVKNGPSPSGSA